MTRFKKLSFLILALSLALWPAISRAADFKSGNDIVLPSDETIAGSLYAASSNITINGEISGDLIAVAKDITINGRLDGDLLAVAQNITVNGEVNGNVRVAATKLEINGQIARNVNAIATSINVGPQAKIGWDLLVAAPTVNIQGIIKGGVDADSTDLSFSGKIGQNLNFRGKNANQKLNITGDAIINGDLYYNQNTKLSIADSANIGGKSQALSSQAKKKDWTKTAWSIIYTIFAMILVALVINAILKKRMSKYLNKIEEKSGNSFLWGLLIIFALPLLSLLLSFTLIGIPLAIMMLLSWIVLFFLGKIITAIYIGDWIIKKTKKDKSRAPLVIAALSLGVTISWLLFAIPYIGSLISLAASAIGLGALILSERPEKNIQ